MFGAYLFCEGPQRWNLLKSLVTKSRVVCIIHRTHTGNNVSQNDAVK